MLIEQGQACGDVVGGVVVAVALAVGLGQALEGAGQWAGGQGPDGGLELFFTEYHPTMALNTTLDAVSGHIYSRQQTMALEATLIDMPI